MQKCCSYLLILSCFIFGNAATFAIEACTNSGGYIPCCDKQTCCGNMGGISYCDTSASRYVCNNGYYSTCYCNRHAIMELQQIQGCCLWQGGVLLIDPLGLVICNDGSVSEICSLQPQP